MELSFLLGLLLTSHLTRFVRASDDNGEGAFGSDIHPVVHTSKGPVRGLKWVSSWTNQTIYSFRGIPFAAPPVGELRFKAPIPPKPWTTVLDCTADKAVCPQDNDGTIDKMSEDCLFINVYSPNVREFGDKPQKQVPVIVYFYGGSFLKGSGSYTSYGPDTLLSENVVVVTFNYRVGALGFLSLCTAGAPGNAGLKDQLMALRWVRAEVHRFGGDPCQVTIFGQSAGSVSVHLHYLSPMSEGMFERAIGDSGSALCYWAVRDDGRPFALRLAALLNCSNATEAAVEECLLAADPQQMVQAQALVTTSQEEVLLGNPFIFLPTVDKCCSENPFLPEKPLKLLQQGVGSRVKFLMGTNSDEGLYPLFLSSEEDIRSLQSRLEAFIPPEVRNTNPKERIKELTEKIKSFYFMDPKSSYRNQIKGYIKLKTDVSFADPTEISARFVKSRNCVFLYKFSFNGAFKDNDTKYYSDLYNVSGVTHGEELYYLFKISGVNQVAPKDSNEIKTLKRMVRLWTNFAKYGNPTVCPDSLLQNVEWIPVSESSMRYLHIDRDLVMSSDNYQGASLALWHEVGGLPGVPL